ATPPHAKTLCAPQSIPRLILVKSRRGCNWSAWHLRLKIGIASAPVPATSLRAETCAVRRAVSAHHALAIFPVRLAEFALEDLAGSRQRQRACRDLDAARALVACDQRLAE